MSKSKGRAFGNRAQVYISCSMASRLQLIARSWSSLMAICSTSWDQRERRWQIHPRFGAASLQQLLNRNSPSMPCWSWGKELKDSWAGCVINSLHDWCTPSLLMSQLKTRQEKCQYFQTHHSLFISTLPDRTPEQTQSLWVLSKGLVGTYAVGEKWNKRWHFEISVVFSVCFAASLPRIIFWLFVHLKTRASYKKVLLLSKS